jgi:iron complex transport system ATP-binding protein
VTARLACDGVAVTLGGRPVLRDVALEVAPGEVVGLLGRNGAGKTTLVRVATRVLAPERGTLRLEGRALESYSRRELARRVAVVPQHTQIPFPFRAGEVVLMGRAPHQGLFGLETARDVEVARRAMRRLDVAHLADRSVLELSGGERQLVVVARALAQEADLLLLDEPTAFLDLEHRLRVLEVLRERAASGASALVVSHDLTLAARFCDRLALLAEGRILAAGPPAEVLTPLLLRDAFAIEAEILHAADHTPVVHPRQTAPRNTG